MPESPIRILFVEDNISDAKLLELELTRNGLKFTSVRVDNEADYIHALKADPHIVLCDWNLPRFNGQQALAILREQSPHTPFILVSGSIGEEAAVQIIKEGAFDYLLKDRLGRLPTAVHQALLNRSLKLSKEQALIALRDSESRLAEAQRIARIGSWGWEPSSNKVWWSDFICVLYGIDRETVPPSFETFLSLLHPEDRPTAIARVDAILAGAEGFANDLRIIRPDGVQVWIHSQARVTRDATGVILRVEGTDQDITDRKLQEKALLDSEERYRLAIRATNDAVWDIDTVTGKIYWSERYTELFGRETETADSWQWWIDRIHPDDRLRTSTSLRNAIDGPDQYWSSEYRFLRPDATWAEIHDRAYIARDEQGRARRAIGAMQDVTDRKRAEAELRRTTELLQAVAENTNDAVFVKNLAGQYLLFNQAAARYVGKSVEEVLGKDDSSIFAPNDALKVMENDRRVMESGESKTTEEELTVNGITRTFLATKSPYRDAQGNIIGVIGISHDITNRKRVEQELQLRDRAIGAATQGLVITDPNLPDNPIVYVSPGYERITGYESTEVLGRNSRFLQGKDTDPNAVLQIRESVKFGKHCSVEFLNYRKDGTPFWNELSISPVRDNNGKLTHFVGVNSDVTARRELEEQYRHSQKMEAVGHLAGGVAHDFNNLLTIINGYGELVLGNLPEKDLNHDLLKEIVNAGKRASGLTRQLLAFSRKAVIEPKVFELKNVVIDLERMLRRIVGEDIQISIDIEPEVCAVRADEGHIEQVILNLVVNARDAMPRGGYLSISVGTKVIDEEYVRKHPDLRPGPYVVLEVTDTGCGMDDATISRIFEPFFSTKGEHGTGLGLATVHGIIKQAGGHVDVSSKIDQGTTFKVYLPKVESPQMNIKSRSGQLAMPRGTETILLVEDEDGIRSLTRHILRKCGYSIFEARDGIEALTVAEAQRYQFQLLLTDVVMPRMGGRELSERLLAQNPRLKVLYVSGYTDDAVVRHGIMQAEVAFLQKPFTPIALAMKIREVLDQQ